MKPLELNVLFREEEDAELERLGIAPKKTDLMVDRMTFYEINGVAPYTEEDNEESWCSIFCNGEMFICIESYETVKRKIQNNL